MKAVLDSTVMINLIHSDRLPLIPRISESLSWQFVMPYAVYCELEEKHTGLLSSLSDYRISIGPRRNARFLYSQMKLMKLERGETDAICTVEECADRTFKGYLILTDDKRARKKANKLGMETMGTPVFLLTANVHGMLSKHDAIQAVETLEDHRYSIPQSEKQDFIDSLE